MQIIELAGELFPEDGKFKVYVPRERYSPLRAFGNQKHFGWLEVEREERDHLTLFWASFHSGGFPIGTPPQGITLEGDGSLFLAFRAVLSLHDVTSEEVKDGKITRFILWLLEGTQQYRKERSL